MPANVVSAVYGRNEPAWHREGIVLPGLLSARDVERYVKPPHIKPVPTYYPVYNDSGKAEKYVHAEGYRVINAYWQDGTVTSLGQVTDSWKPIQFGAAFHVFEPILKDMDAIFDAAGVLDGGKVFWCLAHLPESFSLIGTTNDKSERYLLFTTKNDGTGSAIVKVCWIRVVCANTLAMALSNKQGEFRIRHTGDIDFKLDEAKKVVESAWESFKEGEKNFDLMHHRKVTQEERKHYIHDVFGWDLGWEHDKDLSDRTKTRRKNQTKELVHIFKEGKGTEADCDKDSLWHMFNTMTEYAEYCRTVRGGNGRLNSTQFGSGAKFKEDAYKKALELVGSPTGSNVKDDDDWLSSLDKEWR